MRSPSPLPRLFALTIVAAAFASSGATCPQVIRGYQVGTMPLPRALPPQPSLDQIIARISVLRSESKSLAKAVDQALQRLEPA